MHPTAAAAGAALATLFASTSVFAASYAAPAVNLGHLYASPAPEGCAGSGWYCRASGGGAPGQEAAGSQGTQGTGGRQGSQSSQGSETGAAGGSQAAGGGTASGQGGGAGAGSATGAGSGAGAGAAATGLTGPEQQMLNLVNQARAQNGLGPLSVNPTLQRLAEERAAVMAENGAITHDVPGYGLPAQMEAAAGYSAYASGAEDIAAAGSILQAYAMFRTSATHWSNIIYPSFSQIGVAVVQTQYGEIVDILFSGSQI